MTDKAKVRLLIGDTTLPYHYSDAEIQAFLDMSDGSIFLAAALALEAWASAYLSTAESERIGDYSYSKKSADNMMKLAQRYRDNEETGIVFDIASMDLTAGSAITTEED